VNALETYLTNLIKAQGPISIATFMTEALGNGKYGYYMKQDPFGQKGDFTTAPEISQMFGEMVGLWHADVWLNMNRPDKIHLIELGPGRGTLMQDALRSIKIVRGLKEAITVHLIEISPALRAIQQQTLADYLPANHQPAEWHKRIGDMLREAKGEPILVVANEFFDALPIRQFQKTKSGWHERLVCLDKDKKLILKLAPVPAPEQIIPSALHRAVPGCIVEICPTGDYIMEEIAEHINRCGGAALIIDYGYDQHNCGDSLQAVKNHQYANILQDPGDHDLTAHVNFCRLKEIALKCGTKAYGSIGQGKFLKSLGIRERAKSLCVNASDDQKKNIRSALHRLTAEDEMGTLFKVMAVTEVGLAAIAGFEV